MTYDFVNQEVLNTVKALEYFTRQSFFGNAGGGHRSLLRGSSVEFSEYRKYLPGDDLRRLDWKAYGRSDRFFLKEYESETNLRAYFMLDQSGSMGFASPGQQARLHYAKQLIFALSELFAAQGDAICLYGAQKRGGWSVSHRRHLYQSLESCHAAGVTNLPAQLLEISQVVPKRALIFVFSDLFMDLEELQDALQRLAHQKHEVVLFHLLDPQECTFSIAQPREFVDLESGEAILSNPRATRRAYLKAFEAYLEEVKARCARVQVDYYRPLTNQSIESVLREFLVRATPLRN